MVKSDEAQITCRAVNLDTVRELAPIGSDFETDRVFRLQRNSEDGHLGWRLSEERLGKPLRKTYDRGHPDEWLEVYADSTRLEDLRFIAASVGDEVVGLLTWQYLRWNNTIWLIDIRVRRSARRRGIGTALIGQVKNTAARRRARGITVETQINNYPAISFYQRHGFVVAGFNDHLYTNHDLDRQDAALFLFWERQ